MLAELEKDIQSSGVDLASSTAESLAGSLKTILRSSLKKEKSADKLQEVLDQVDSAKQQIQQGLQKVVENGNVLEGVQERSEQVVEVSQVFLDNSKAISRQMRIRALKMKCGGILAVLAITGYFVVGLLPDDFVV